MPEYYGFNFLRQKLAAKAVRNDLRYGYYEAKYGVRDLGYTLPPELRYMQTVLGWAGKAVDSLADRLIFRDFGRPADDFFDMNGIFNANNPDILFDSAILSALITAVSFIYISAGDNGFPRLQVIDGSNATGIMDPITGLLFEGYAVLERDKMGVPLVEAYFLPNKTEFYHGGKPMGVFNHPVDYPLLVPIVYKPDARRPFGHSRISRAGMGIIQAACRTFKRSEISAEFYSYPQRYVLGLSEETDELDKWKTTMSTMLDFRKDEDGDRPVVGQFQQQSMSPYTEQLRTFASMYAGETGLTLDDLGFVADNPSSAEAIKASHENLRLLARKAQRSFGSGLMNAGFLAACLRDEYTYTRDMMVNTAPRWEPIFEPDAAMLSAIGDGVIKLNQAVEGYIGAETLRDLTGIKSSESPEGDAE